MDEAPDPPLCDLLLRQTEMLQKAIEDLRAIRQALPPEHHARLDAISAKLEVALDEDMKLLKLA